MPPECDNPAPTPDAGTGSTPMTPERWLHIEDLLNRALDVDTNQRLGWLRSACAEDEDLFREVSSLVASHGDMGEFLEQPAVAGAPRGEVSLEGGALVPELASGTQVAGWRVLHELGRGGMGTVYLAERIHEDFIQKGALKLLHGASAQQTVLRFQQERRILAQLNHPNIARLLDGGSTEDGRPYLVMEHIEGEPIDQYCDRHRLSITQRLHLFRKICSAVHFFHQSLVLHRDLKPSNILITAEGEPKLLDFGVAKLLAGDVPDRTMAPTALHTGGPAPLTLDYASPEQLRGEAVTTASDVYALGVLLYELLSGHRPHRPTTSLPAKLERLCNEEPEPPSQAIDRDETRERADGSVLHLDPASVSTSRDLDAPSLRRRLSGDLDSIVLMALEKKPVRRYASVEQLSEDVQNYLQGLPVRAHQSTPIYRAWKFVRRNALAVAAAATFIFLLTSFSVYAEVLRQRARKAAVQAQTEQRVARGALNITTRILEGASPDTGDPGLTVGELIQQVLDELPEMLGEDPEIRVHLLDEVGRLLKDLGRGAEEVLPLYREAVNLGRQLDQPHQLAETLLNLGGNLSYFGDHKAGEPYILEAIELLEKHHGSRAQFAEAFNHLGGIRRRIGPPSKAEVNFRKALEFGLAEADVDAEFIATVRHNLSTLLLELGQLEEAEALGRKALETRIDLQVSPTALATTHSNLGRILQYQGRLAAAEEELRRSLELRQKVYEKQPLHRKLAPAHNNLGYVLFLRQDLAGAQAHLEEALRIQRSQQRIGRPNLGAFLRNYAEILLAQGRLDEALQQARLARQTLEEVYKHPQVSLAEVDSVLGACLLALGDTEAATLLLRQGYESLLQALGPDAPKTRRAWQRLQKLEPQSPEQER